MMDSSVSLLVLATLMFICTGITNSKTHECLSGIKKCYTAFSNDVNHRSTGTEICRDVGSFVKCILEMDCDLPRNIKHQSFDFVETELAKKGLKCDEIAKLKETYVHKPQKSFINSGPRATVPKYSKESNYGTQKIIETTPKAFQKSMDPLRASGTPLPTVDDDSYDSLEPYSSRRSRRLPRPKSWSNWGPQSQSSSDSNLGQPGVRVSFSIFGSLAIFTILYKYIYNVLLI